MLTITYGPIRSVITCEELVERKLAFSYLDAALSIPVNDHFFVPEFKDGLWDGHEHFFSLKTGRFDSGFLPLILSILREANEFEYEVVGYPAPRSCNVSSLTLHDNSGLLDLNAYPYDYQGYTIRQSLKYHRGVWNIATNGGKTEITAGLLKVLGCPPSMVVIPRKDILAQTVDRLEDRLQVKVGVIGDSIWKPNYSGPNVGMFQTLSTKLSDKAFAKWFKTIEVVIGDECQFMKDKRYQKVFNSTNAAFRFGVSGTPFPKRNEVHKHTTIGLCGPVISSITNAELIERGISVPAHLLFVEPDMSLKEMLALKVLDHYVALQKCEVRNQAIADLARAFLAAGMQTVIMVKKVEHGKAILKHIPEAVLTHSGSGNRKAVKNRLTSGEVFCCICTSIFDTGLSVDYIEGLILAGGGVGDMSLLQAVGRGLRRAKDKVKNLWVVDFWDTFNDYTKRHSRARYNELKDQEAFTLVDRIEDAPEFLQNACDFLKTYVGRH